MGKEPSTFQGTGAKLLYDVCGPTAKYFGEEALLLAKAGRENLGRILEIALRKLSYSDKTDGEVPPNVIRKVISQGYFCEDAVAAEYLGGMLASSKSGISRDDRAVPYLSIIESMSSYQLRTHFILYSAILRMDNETYQSAGSHLWKSNITVSLLVKDYVAAMEFSDDENAESILQHSFIGLEGRQLIKDGGLMEPSPYNKIPSGALYFYPTSLGMELFIWGCGRGGGDLLDYNPSLLENLPTHVETKPYNVALGIVKYVT